MVLRLCKELEGLVFPAQRSHMMLGGKLSDLFDSHPFEISLSVALVLFGSRSLASGLQAAPGSIQGLPFWLSVGYCVLSVLGGLGVLVGLFCRVLFDWAYGLERFGLFVSASAWASYIVGLAFAPITIRSTLLILALLALSFGCLWRSRAINKKAKATLDALRFASHNREDGNG